jgi:hypothetical protein
MNLWVTDDATDSELLYGYEMLVAKTLKGAAVRLFKSHLRRTRFLNIIFCNWRVYRFKQTQKQPLLFSRAGL